MVPDIVISMPHPPPLVCKEGWVQNKCGHVPILSVSCIVCQVRIWRKVQQQGEGGGVHIMKRKRIRLFWESTLWKERESETILGMGTNLSSGFTPQIFLFLFSRIRASSSSPSIVLSSCLTSQMQIHFKGSLVILCICWHLCLKVCGCFLLWAVHRIYWWKHPTFFLLFFNPKSEMKLWQHELVSIKSRFKHSIMRFTGFCTTRLNTAWPW